MSLVVFRGLKEDGYGVCHFRDKELRDPFAPAHFYISVPFSGINELVLVMITSQWEKLEARYRREGALSGIVILGATEFGFLSKPKSLIDCNQYIRSTPEGLALRVDETYCAATHRYDEIIPDYLKTRIYRALMESPVVNQRTKSKLIPP